MSIAHQMIEGLVPSADVAHWKEERKVTLAEFSRLKDIPLSTIGCVIILAGPGPMDDAMQKICKRLSAEAGDKVQIEFALAHSCAMTASADLVIDASRNMTSSRAPPL
ncbi:hypothetical protein [Rhizobium mulingense]|uniref:hypothetical protein n=1 Tax=Rhizobium mulingense TaxID=3031128 RepID=UPI002B4A6AB8|nr:hypothetical protein [Rhizobium sp. MJ21]MEB3043138.1 hypothetical protein [Rhizobium sp. MJ21]